MTRIYFVIDTDHYAGNFERQMCAYVTGQTGDCGVGAKQVMIFEDEVGDPEKFEDLVGSEADDNGCFRPVKIYPNPDWFNNGVGGHYRNDEPNVMERAQKEHDESVRNYANNNIRRCYSDKTYANEEADRHIKAGVGKPVTKHPAYMSVAICLNREPIPEEIEFFKKRATTYGKIRSDIMGKKSPIEVTGFRLVKIREVEEARSL